MSSIRDSDSDSTRTSRVDARLLRPRHGRIIGPVDHCSLAFSALSCGSLQTLGQAVSRLFISHSSANDNWALALQAWLIREGWSGEEDIFLDLDPERGIVAGQRWVRALEDAATRCEAVLFLISEVWLASKW